MKAKALNLLLIITSLTGYLEWGKGNAKFLFQLEAEIISKTFYDPASVLHPLVLIPLAGQLLLLYTLFQKKPGKLLTLAGIAGTGVLLVFMFVIGCIDLDFKILISTVPFLIVAYLTLTK